MSILLVEDLAIAFGGLVAVDGITFAVEPREIFAVIGPNGAGKTTLFNIVSGLYSPHRGRILLAGEDVTNLAPHELARRGLSRTFQNLQIFFRMSVIENVMVGRHVHEKRNVLTHLFTLPSVHAQNRTTRAKAAELLALVGLTNAADRPAGSLPYGALKRLDIVLVEHDMRLVMRISNRIHVLDRGRTLAEGNAQDIRSNPAVIAAYLGRMDTQEGKTRANG
jgi:branched-chain amino acid transport system ATP-binding protein